MTSSEPSQVARCRQALAALRAGDAQPHAAWLRHHLFTHVLPFWERHAFDPQGGLLTCLSDAGEILGTEKWLWSQWRAVWVFSRVYRSLQRDARWLRAAREIADFCVRHGWDAGGDGWALLVAQDGRILRGAESIYVDAFAIYGLVELHRSTGDEALLQWARRTAEAALQKLKAPRDRVPHFPYPIPPGAKPHGIPMMWSLVLAELGVAAREERYLAAAAEMSAEIFRDFHRPDRDLIVEWTGGDGRELPPPLGTAVVPGHAIEDMWFQVHIARLLGRGVRGTEELLRLVLRHLALGWDETNGGGLLLAVDANGARTVGWRFADTKLWWPHTEALFATLLGWTETRDAAFLDWHARLWPFCLEHYADWQHGEWRQKLDRALSPIESVVALPVKDPFHLPRSLILQIELLEGRPG